jgi:ribosome assembly protein YihI (activator of Der GTPase)
MKPEDPHEFMMLLSATEMESLKRNQALADLAQRVRTDFGLKAILESEDWVDCRLDFAETFESDLYTDTET